MAHGTGRDIEGRRGTRQSQRDVGDGVTEIRARKREETRVLDVRISSEMPRRENRSPGVEGGPSRIFINISRFAQAHLHYTQHPFFISLLSTIPPPSPRKTHTATDTTHIYCITCAAYIQSIPHMCVRNAHVYPSVSNEHVLAEAVSIFLHIHVCTYLYMYASVICEHVGMCVSPRGRLRTPRTKWSPLILSSAVSQSVFFFYFILFLRDSSR